ncbi:hypothetical protein ACQW02_16790 [Humitalea sp. 24SJ18S-53]|uniref:hypothetical protein n=1 Tax=Humitalea sp. 24SJ18S-53 TaxID=3422307 RepID=UPI003D674AB2
MSEANESWFPLFEFKTFLYRSFLVAPSETFPAGPVILTDWMKAEFICEQATREGDLYQVNARLVLRPGSEVLVDVRSRNGIGDRPATFEATGHGMTGDTAGAVYRFSGLVHPALPTAFDSAVIDCIRGAVTSVQGPASTPLVELGGCPVGTAGAFVIVPSG